jgi:hypothetical protein
MILFPEVGRCGRLGNQLFQISSSLALAYKHNTDFFLPHDIYERVHDGQQCLLKHFVNNIKMLPNEVIPQTTRFQEELSVSKKIDTRYFELGTNVSLHGFFESEQYFEEYKERIKSVFQFEESIDNFSTNYINVLKSLHNDAEIVGIHFRRGDYHEPQKDPGMFFRFAQQAITEYFQDKPYIFLIFSGGNKENSGEDIEYCKEMFSISKDHTIVFCELKDTIRELSIMTNCDHMILTTKSTLGWWGAYLNKNKDKKIIVPKEYIGPEYNSETLWPKEFTQMSPIFKQK